MVRNDSSAAEQVASWREQFVSGYESGGHSSIEDVLASAPPELRKLLLRELILAELELKNKLGETISTFDYERRFAEHREIIAECFGQKPSSGGNASTAPFVTANFDTKPPGTSGDDSPPASPPDQFGDYELLNELGRGGMGVVYRAKQKSADRIVALKVIRADRLADLDSEQRVQIIERFRAEARAAASLEHDNVLTVYDVGTIESQPYYSMRLVEGCSLAELLSDGPLTNQRAARYMEQTARAIQEAHSHGILHRDLKPQNVMVDARSDRALVADFGLAKLVEGDRSMTRTGEVFGSPPYMAPEQATDAAKVTAAADIYSLGATLYHLVTGRPPFQAASVAETLRQVLDEDPVSPRQLNPSVDRDLETVCMKCLEKDPLHRYETAEALASDLQRYLKDEPILARRVGLVNRLWRRARKRKRLLAFSAAAAIALVVASIFAWRGFQERKVSDVLTALEAGLDVEQWDAAHLQEMETIVSDLKDVAPAHADDAQRRIHERFATSIREMIKQPRLENSQIQEIESRLKLLAAADATASKELEELLARRMTRWQPIFEIASPFKNIETVLDPAAVQPAGDALMRKAALAAAESRIVTRVAGGTRVQIEADFHSSWEDCSRLGLLLNCGDSGGYEFVLRVGGDGKDIEPGSVGKTDRTFAAARTSEADVYAEILRDKRVLARKNLQLSKIKSGNLRMLAQRSGDRLSFQINNESPLDFQVVFAGDSTEQGFFGLIWPTTVKLARLSASKQILAIDSSPLQAGDEFYAQGDFAAAIAEYEKLARQTEDQSFRDEAHFKRAMCLEKLGRRDDAAAQFAKVFAEEGDRWPPLAGCQLWLLRLREKDSDAADAVFETLAARYEFRDLITFLPEADRSAIHVLANPYTAINADSHAIDKVLRARAIEMFLAPEFGRAGPATYRLFSTYRIAGEFNEAIRLAEEALQNPPQNKGRYWPLCESYVDLIGEQRSPRAALDIVNRFLFESPGVYDKQAQKTLLIARARTHIALDHKSEARDDLRTFLEVLDPTEQEGFRYIDAHLILGFLHEQDGDTEAAKKVWAEGVQIARKGGRGGRTDAERAQQIVRGGSHLLYYVVAASLTDQLTSEDAEMAFNRMFSESGLANSPTLGPTLGNPIVRRQLFSANRLRSVFDSAWHSPRGREFARRIAFGRSGQIARGKYWEFAKLFGHQYMVDGAFLGKVSPDQDAVIWDLCTLLLSGLIERKIDAASVMPMALIWKGYGGSDVGWPVVAKSLADDKEMRGSLAYVFAKRQQQLKKPEQARSLFHAALADAKPDSVLHRLAQAELADRSKPNAEP